jgi:hypothetical protein
MIELDAHPGSVVLDQRCSDRPVAMANPNAHP